MKFAFHDCEHIEEVKFSENDDEKTTENDDGIIIVNDNVKIEVEADAFPAHILTIPRSEWDKNQTRIKTQ